MAQNCRMAAFTGAIDFKLFLPTFHVSIYGSVFSNARVAAPTMRSPLMGRRLESLIILYCSELML